MSADLIPPDRIPERAAQIDSLPLLLALRLLQKTGFLFRSDVVNQETEAVLQRLAEIGFIDPGYDGTGNGGKPFIWVRNLNGENVLRYIERSPSREAALQSNLQIHRRAHTALATLPEKDQLGVLAAVESLQTSDPTSWLPERVEHVGSDKSTFLLRVSPALRAFIKVLDSGGIELLDIVGEETLRLFLERYQAGSGVG